MLVPENTLIPIAGFSLPADFAARVDVPAAIAEYCAANPRVPQPPRLPRFMGYFFRQKVPFAVCGIFQLTLEDKHPVKFLPGHVAGAVGPQYRIVSQSEEVDPLYMLVHDSRYGNCWLQRFEYALSFLQASEPQFAAGDAWRG